MAIDFDLKEIPQSADIINATFSLYFIDGDSIETGKPNVCTLYTISKEWNEEEITWDNASKDVKWENIDPDTKFFHPDSLDTIFTKGGCDFDTLGKVVAPYVPKNQWENYDVTDIIKRKIKDQNSFYGFMIKQYVCPKIESTHKVLMNLGRSYKSSEVDSIELRPKLTITYNSTAINDNNYYQGNLIKEIAIKKSEKWISFYSPLKTNYWVLLFNLKGEKVFSYQGFGKKWITLSSQTISQGIYFLHIHTKNEALIKKVIWSNGLNKK